MLSQCRLIFVIAVQSNDISNEATAAVSSSRKDGFSYQSDFFTPQRDPSLPCHIIPLPKNNSFYGRHEILGLIEDRLSPSRKTKHDGDEIKLKTFAICGPGGIGKTQVANEFAATHKDVYEAIFWVHAQKATILADEFSHIAESLGLVLEGTSDSRDHVITRDLLKGWLANPIRSHSTSDNNIEEVPWLLIFDNAEDSSALSEFWPPAGSSGSVLVTSRDPLAKSPWFYEDLRGVSGIDLPELSDDDAAELLLRLTWREQDSEEQRQSMKVAKKLGGFPLAITQMAGVMVRQTLSFNDFLNRYEEEETHGKLFNLSLAPSHKRTTYGHTLASVWALEELEYGSGLLDIMSFLDPDGIPEQILQGRLDKVNLAGYPNTVTGYQNARGELINASLISLSASKLIVHRMIQDGARAKMNLDRATQVFTSAVDILWSSWPVAEAGVRHHVARWVDCEPLSPHILRLKEHYLRAGKGLKSRLISNLTFASLLNELGW